MDENSSSYIRLQCILHDSGVIFWKSSNFYKLRRVDVISGGTNFAESLNYLDPPSLFQFLKIWWTKIHGHLLDFNAFYMIQEYFSYSLEISTN